MNDIEYEKDGVKKFTQERFKEDLAKVGWYPVEKKTKKPVKKKVESNADSKNDN